MSFRNFLKRNYSFFRLAIKNQLEYRINFLTDILLQPSITAWIEMLLWKAVFLGLTNDQIAGYDKSSYLAYALWAAFISRISSNWMYEFKMIEEIETGSINALLTRPFSFFEYYFSQFLGYKTITTAVSIFIPIIVSYSIGAPINFTKISVAIALVFCYLFFIFTLSFLVATTAFHLTRVSSLTVAKNLALWLFSGELLPLDLFPKNLFDILISLPFSNATYIPVGYITGRVSIEVVQQGFISLVLSSIILFGIAKMYWDFSLKKYAGTAA